MPQTVPPDPEVGRAQGEQGASPIDQTPSTLISQLCLVDDHGQDHPTTMPNGPNQPSQVESNFGDSSGPLFTIYYKAAEEEDNKMVKRWQDDAKGILIFVSPRVGIRLSLHMNRSWSTGIP